jgi:hypothetical protein
MHNRLVVGVRYESLIRRPLEQEAIVKKKGKPNIPDFSRKRPGPPTPDQRVAAPAPAARTPIVKPHSTSAKSGRRGQ